MKGLGDVIDGEARGDRSCVLDAVLRHGLYRASWVLLILALQACSQARRTLLACRIMSMESWVRRVRLGIFIIGPLGRARS